MKSFVFIAYKKTMPFSASHDTFVFKKLRKAVVISAALTSGFKVMQHKMFKRSHLIVLALATFS